MKHFMHFLFRFRIKITKESIEKLISKKYRLKRQNSLTTWLNDTRRTTLHVVSVGKRSLNLLIDEEGLFTDVPASNKPDDALPRWFTADCAVPRPARDIFALILEMATDSCDPDSRTGKRCTEVELAYLLVKSRQTFSFRIIRSL